MPEQTACETKAANILKAELKRRGVTYAQLMERPAAIEIDEDEKEVKGAE